MSSNITVSGWLRKSPPEKKLRKNAWRKRWFVLRSGRLSGDPNLLEYYKHQGSKKPVGAISLDECSQIDANVPVKYERKDPSNQFVFDIVTRTRTYYLVAESLPEMSFWVRHLCDLCGFNHDTPDNQQDLGSQQQTFRANQSRGSYPNGMTALLDNEQEPPTDAPAPLPRPERTMTSRSILIKNRGNNGQATPQAQSGSTSAESTQPSISGTPGSLRRIEMKQNNGYSYAAESTTDQAPPAQPELTDDSEYLFLTDFKTAQTSQKKPESNFFMNPNSLRERRSSSDSVFTHEGAPSDGGSDVIVEQPLHIITPRYASSRKQRLDSMPDCPPPPPPGAHTERPRITMIDERGYSYPNDDENDDVIVEARKRSIPTSGGGLSPIDDSDLNGVPPGLQRDCGVDEMGKRVQSGYSQSSGYDTEYINTADASTEVRFGNLSSQRADASQQHLSVGALYSSPANRSTISQATNNSSVFFTSPGPSEWGYTRATQLYDTPSPIVPMYTSPRTASPHHSMSHKSSLYSSTNTLSPFGPRGPSMRMTSPQPSPAHGARMRRSSSVGQLENVANELSAQTSSNVGGSPSRVRRTSIDQRLPVYNIPLHPAMVHPAFHGSPAPLKHLMSDPNIPPPRPPKLDPSCKEALPDPESSEYLNLSGCYTDGVPPSPPHTEVIALSIRDLEEQRFSSPPHTSIVRTIPVGEDGTVKREDKEGEGETSRSSSSSGGSSGGSSSGRSSAAAVYDVTAPSLREPPGAAPMYDMHRKVTETSLGGNDIYDNPKTMSLYDTPKNATSSLYDTPKLTKTSLYDTPTNKAAQLADIDENRLDYEPMQDQLSPINDEIRSYTCMVGATNLINTPPFVKKPPMSPQTGRPPAISEPPPVKRDLKPKVGRASLGSDGGGVESSKLHSSRSSYDDPHFDQGRLVEPISPPHAVLIHTMPSSAFVAPPGVNSLASQDRLLPPERPPKFPSQSTLSPRTPPSISPHVPDRPPHNFDRTRHSFDGLHLQTKKPSGPGRPPKPISMLSGQSLSPNHSSLRQHRDLGRSSMSYSGPGSSVFSHNHGGSFVVPPPGIDSQERNVTYVELGQLEHRGGPVSRNAPLSAERMSKGDTGVEYSVLDPEKTEALQKMKTEREKEQLKRGAADSRSIKGGKT